MAESFSRVGIRLGLRLVTLSACILIGLVPRAGAAPSDDLDALFAEAWDFELLEDPLQATEYGDHRHDDRLPSVLPEDFTRRANADREFLRRLLAIDRAQLSRQRRISYDIFARLRQDSLREFEFQAHLMPITNRSGFHISFPELPRNHPLRTMADYESYVARLEAFGPFVDQHIELMREGLQQGVTLPAVVLHGCEQPIQAQIVDDPRRSPLFKPFTEFPPSISEGDRPSLAEAAQRAIAQTVVPGYERFLEFMTKEYVPAARLQAGASALPRGREFYRHRVQQFTTLDITPEEVHQTGLSEVRRILEEMQDTIRQTGFQGDLPAFLEHLRTDPKFYATTPEMLLEKVSLVLKRIDGELPRLFKSLPRMPYGVREIPAFIAPYTTTAYYSPPAGDGTRAGAYFVNTYDLKSRPLYEIEALSLHEAVPGHHLQIALQQELTDMPPFQRFAGITAFVEGWGLYAERLGLEVGFYQDPYSNFGRLSYEMWRACRLVVDTGIHYLGWTREQAIEYMASHTALARHNVTTEVDRYIAWPGQALGYKIGELKIRQLRALAEERLGGRFDVREFHDVVLGSGAVPLSVLEANVEEYLRMATAR